MYDYRIDPYGKLCLDQAEQGRSFIGFGAILVKNEKIIGMGRNRRSTAEDRKLLPYVDYCAHAEQACIIDAIKAGHDITNATVYVLGIVLKGANKGELTIKKKKRICLQEMSKDILKI